MPVPIPTSLDVITLAILAQLQAQTGLGPEACYPSQMDDPPFVSQAEQVLIVRMEEGQPDLGVWKGAGRYDVRERQEFTVTVRTRCALDEIGHDLAWLTDAVNSPALGHLQFRHKVRNALLEFQPFDGAGNLLTTAPIAPALSRRPKKDTKETEWGESLLWFSFVYNLLMSPLVLPTP